MSSNEQNPFATLPVPDQTIVTADNGRYNTINTRNVFIEYEDGTSDTINIDLPENRAVKALHEQIISLKESLEKRDNLIHTGLEVIRGQKYHIDNLISNLNQALRECNDLEDILNREVADYEDHRDQLAAEKGLLIESVKQIQVLSQHLENRRKVSDLSEDLIDFFSQ